MKKKAAAPYSIVWKNSISGIDQSAWDDLAEPLRKPMLEWEWLRLLEDSGSVQPETGWLPYHLTVWSGSRLVGAAPLYVKGHSSGEFVFDHAWADLADRLGIRYYPKLVGMSPFSPLVGYRFLIAPDQDEDQITRLMVSAILWEDYALAQGAILLVAVCFVLVNLMVDVSYAWLDPRIRYG